MPNIGDTLSGQASVLSELVASLLEPVLAAYDAGFGMFDLLTAVQGADGKLTQAEIATRMGIRPPSLTEAIRGAVRKGLVQQVGVEGDLRTKRVRLTNKGRSLLQQCLQTLHEAEEVMVQGIDSKDIETTLSVLRQANQNLLPLLKH